MTRHIKLIGKTYPRIDPIKVAKALGADTIISGRQQTKDGLKYIEFTSVKKDGRRITRRIYELDKNNTKKYTLLGTAEGTDFWQCVNLAIRFVKKDFQKRICGYYFDKSYTPGCSLSISFYAKK